MSAAMSARLGSALVAFAFGWILLSPAASAQPARVFVAAQGADGNPCTFAAPCRTFQHAHDTVAAGGEIDVLDPAGYGAVTITKSISIQGHGFAGISASSGSPTPITVTAGASDRINLRGLLLDGAAVVGGNAGISFQSGASLNVQDSVIRNFPGGEGISFIPDAGALFVSNTLVADSHYGIDIGMSSGTGAISATLDRVALVNLIFSGLNVNSFTALRQVNVSITGSTIAGVGGPGISVTSSASQQSKAVVLVKDSMISNNSVGLLADTVGSFTSLAVIFVSTSVVTGNTQTYISHGPSANPGIVSSYGDNNIDGNGDSGIPGVGPVLK